MSKEDLNQQEEVSETKPADGSESEQVDELQDLFADDSQEDENEEDKVTRLEKKLENIQNGVNKYFSEQGRKAKEDVKTKPESKVVAPSDDISELFYAQIPKAELVSDDLKTIAESKYNGSILKAWKGESWIQEKASALESTKNEDEANKSKISKPSNGTSPKRVDILKVKPEDVGSLKPADKAVWVKAQVEKERRDE